MRRAKRFPSRHHVGTEGQYSHFEESGARFRFNLIPALNSPGQMRFMLTGANVDNEVCVEFLRRLPAGAQQPIFLVVDAIALIDPAP